MTSIVLARGDGIGPEVADATVRILEAAGADLDIKEVLIGQRAFASGYDSGIESGTVDAIRDTGVMLKAPLMTPSGRGFKSLNVTLRQELELWANIRPAVAYPQLASPKPGLDMVIFRENSEDSYVGLTRDLDPDAYDALQRLFGEDFTGLGYQADGTESIGIQIISDKASERIVRAAFNYVAANKSGKSHAMSKPNILKATDGRFKAAFERVAAEYPEIASQFSIVDAGFGRVITYPDQEGVIVTQNLYGDILSDVFAFQAHGGLGLAPSVNMGGTRDNPVAMFEAVHGTAPDIEGQNKANPSAFLLSAIMMLRFVGQSDVALKIHNALMKTWEEGYATGDVRVGPMLQRQTLGTREFTEKVIANLGQIPSQEFSPSYLVDDYRAALPEGP